MFRSRFRARRATDTLARGPASPAVGAIWAILTAVAGCSDSNGERDPCGPDDVDGVIGGDVAFDLTVDDDGFSPAILTAQNTAKATLTLRNAGT